MIAKVSSHRSPVETWITPEFARQRRPMTDLPDLQAIEFDVTDHVATVTLHPPDQMNSFTEQMADEIARVWARVRDDDDIRVAVLRANGERAFCTGIDVSLGTWWEDKPIFN